MYGTAIFSYMDALCIQTYEQPHVCLSTRTTCGIRVVSVKHKNCETLNQVNAIGLKLTEDFGTFFCSLLLVFFHGFVLKRFY